MRIVVGNLTVPITEEDLQQLFAPYGVVERVQILADRATGQAQAFVEMPEATAAQAAIDGLQGTTRKGRTLTVHEARLQ
jgi:RNA recognition motif-containing protein